MYMCAVPWQSAKVRAVPANPWIEALLFRKFCKWAFGPALKMVKVAPESKAASRPVAYDDVFS